MTTEIRHATADELENGRVELAQSPTDNGTLEMIVRRPGIDQREVLAEAQLSVEEGLVGDNWLERGSSSMPDRSANPKAQLAIMNSRVIQLLAGERERWPLAGDQLYIDLDLSEDNLPPGTQLAIGEVVLEITDQPHTGCAKFTERYGPAAIRFVNSKAGRAARRRGVHARVVVPGIIRAGERVVKVAAE